MIGQTNKTAWITGASSGIGEALAKSFVAAGGFAILSGRNVAELQRVASETGAADRCLILPFDTIAYDGLSDHVAKAIAFQGIVDVLVNNAGISQRSPAVDTDFSVYQRIVDVDLLAPIALTLEPTPEPAPCSSNDSVTLTSESLYTANWNVKLYGSCARVACKGNLNAKVTK